MLWLIVAALGGELPETTELMWAIARGDTARIEALVAAGADLSVRDGNHEDALAWAVRYRSREVVELLLRHGADPNGRGHVGRTPLVVALESVQGGDVAIVRALLEAGARVDVTDDLGRTPIVSAARYGHDPGALRLVLDRASPEVLDAWRREPAVAWTALAGETENVRVLLERGFPADLRDEDGKSPLERAAQQGHLPIVELLRAAGAPVTLLAFHDAALWEHPEVVRALLPGLPAADVDAALVSASWLGDAAVVEQLLGRGARAADGQALEAAADRGHAAVVERLVRAGADLGAHGGAALVAAARTGHDPVVAWLLARGVPATSADGGGRTALAVAAVGGHVEVVERLLRAGAKDLPDQEGQRAMDQVAARREGLQAMIAHFQAMRAIHPAEEATRAELAALEPRWARIAAML